MDMLQDLLEAAPQTDEQRERLAVNMKRNMRSILDTLERVDHKLENPSIIKGMHHLGLYHDRERVARLVDEAIMEFDDIMKSIEVEIGE